MRVSQQFSDMACPPVGDSCSATLTGPHGLNWDSSRPAISTLGCTWLFLLLLVQGAVARAQHHEPGELDTGSNADRDVGASIRTNAWWDLPRATQEADLNRRQALLEQKYQDSEIDVEAYSHAAYLLAMDYNKIGAKTAARNLSFRVIDMKAASPQKRAQAWWAVAETFTSGDLATAENGFSHAVEAFDSAVACLEEIPKDERTAEDFKLEGSVRSWLATSCDIIGARDAGLAERLKILADEDLIENSDPRVALGAFQRVARVYQEQGRLQDAERIKAQGLTYLLKDLQAIDPLLQLSAIKSLALSARTIPIELRIKLLETLWKNPELSETPSILSIGNHLVLFYFFDASSASRQRLPTLLSEMHDRSRQILETKPSEPESGRSGRKKHKISGELRRTYAMYFLQSLVIACEVMPEHSKVSAWRKEISEWVKQIGTAVLVPVNHPNADGKELIAMVKKYAEEPQQK